APGSVDRPGRRVDVRAPQGTAYRSGGPFRPDICLLGPPHRIGRLRPRRTVAARPRLDRADRPAPRGTRDRSPDLTHPPRVTRFPRADAMVKSYRVATRPALRQK